MLDILILKGVTIIFLILVLFLWRLQSYPVINAPAFSLGEGKYTFSQLGFDLTYLQLSQNRKENKTNLQPN